MKNKRSLKQKDLDRLTVLQCKHPGDLTEQEKIELEKLQTLREKYGSL